MAPTTLAAASDGDLLWIIERFATCADTTGRPTYKALIAIFNQQCEVREGKVVVKAKTGGDCIQNPSDADATYDAHKGRGRGHPLSGTKETSVAAFAPLARSSSTKTFTGTASLPFRAYAVRIAGITQNVTNKRVKWHIARARTVTTC